MCQTQCEVGGGGGAAMNVTSEAFANFHAAHASTVASAKLQCHVTESELGTEAHSSSREPESARHRSGCPSKLGFLGTRTENEEIRNSGFSFHLWGAGGPPPRYFPFHFPVERFLLLTDATLDTIWRLQT